MEAIACNRVYRVNRLIPGNRVIIDNYFVTDYFSITDKYLQVNSVNVRDSSRRRIGSCCFLFMLSKYNNVN